MSAIIVTVHSVELEDVTGLSWEIGRNNMQPKNRRLNLRVRVYINFKQNCVLHTYNSHFFPAARPTMVGTQRAPPHMPPVSAYHMIL